MTTLLAEGTIEIGSGEGAFLALELDDEPEIEEPITLEGTISLPELAADLTVVLNIVPFQLAAAGLQAKISIPRQRMTIEENGILGWNAGEVIPGRYVLELEPFQIRIFHTVDADRNLPVALEVPELGDVQVCAVNQAGDPVSLTSVSWQAEPPPGLRRPSFRSARKNEDDDCHRFLAPVGNITMVYSGKGIRRATRKLEIEAGLNEIEFRVQQLPGIHIVLEAAGESFALVRTHPVDASALGFSGKVIWKEARAGTLDLYVSRPGPYQVSFGTIAGLEAVPLQQVTVLAGEVVTLYVEATLSP